MSTLNLTAIAGGSLALVNNAGETDVYSIPQGTTITLTTQRGFGDVITSGTGLSSADAGAAMQQNINQYGAK